MSSSRDHRHDRSRTRRSSDRINRSTPRQQLVAYLAFVAICVLALAGYTRHQDDKTHDALIASCRRGNITREIFGEFFTTSAVLGRTTGDRFDRTQAALYLNFARRLRDSALTVAHQHGNPTLRHPVIDCDAAYP